MGVPAGHEPALYNEKRGTYGAVANSDVPILCELGHVFQVVSVLLSAIQGILRKKRNLIRGMAATNGAFEMLLCLGILVVLVMIWKQKQEETEGFQSSTTTSSTTATPVKIAIASMMRRPTDIALWFEHHRSLGIQRFYIRLEDSPAVAAFLKTQPDVYYEEGKSGDQNNYTTQVNRQRDFVNKMLPKAAAEGVDWVVHIDADELLEGDVTGTLSALPAETLIGKLNNAEAVFGDGEATCFSAKRFIRCDKGGPCTAYVNGKGVGRPVAGVTLGGAHDFVYKGKVDPAVTAQIPFETLHVLHYDSCTIGAWLEKFAHMSKKAKLDDIVFPYYKESIKVAEKAKDLYKKHKMRDDLQPEWTWKRT
jgi:hypothetical protein